jgi:hypothetical protein
MSNSAPSLNSSKNANTAPQAPSSSQSQSGTLLGTENYPQRRSGSGNVGAASASRAQAFTARNNQSLRKQHKGQRRFRLADDDDATAESVSM